MAIRTVRGKNPPSYPFRFQTMPLAQRWCRGNGLELGAAAHNPFGLSNALNVAPWSDDPLNPDYGDHAFYQQAQVDMCGEYAVVDIPAEAHAIPVPDHSQDYVLSSHVVEHLPNLIAAFVEWRRILRPGGIVFMIFPKRDAIAADALRPITPVAHFVEDYERNCGVHDHPLEPGHGPRGHYHVFTLASMLALIDWCNQHLALGWQVEAVEDKDSKIGNGHTVVCRSLPGAVIDNSRFDAAYLAQLRVSPMTWLRLRVQSAHYVLAREGMQGLQARLTKGAR